MKKKPKTKKLRPKDNPDVDRLAGLIGDFIAYWGFKRTHGQIWAYLQLSEKPLCTRDLIELVGVSKGAISHALEELVHFSVVEISEHGLNGMTYYRSSPRITHAIVGILKTRELKLLTEISDAFHAAKKRGAFTTHSPVLISGERAHEIGDWVDLAQGFLTQVIQVAGTDADPFRSHTLLKD